MHMKLNKNQENEKEKHFFLFCRYIYLCPALFHFKLGVSRNDPTDFEEAFFFFLQDA